MAWMLPAAMVASSVIGAATSNQGDSKAGGRPMYTMQNLPQDMQDRLLGQVRGMPSGLNVNFGGQSYPMMYGPQMRAVNALYSPHGAIPYQAPTPSPIAGAMMASAPYYWRAANQVQSQSPYVGSAMGAWSNQTPYGSADPYSFYNQSPVSQWDWGV